MSGTSGLRVEQTIDKLSLAVSLTDDYTARAAAAGSVAVAIPELNLTAMRNLSGYYLFINIPVGSYTVTADADYYFPASSSVDTSKLDPLNPVLAITLKPCPSYPFPSEATLLRGGVRDGTGKALQGASLVTTVLGPDSSIKATLVIAVAKGAQAISLSNIVGSINAGDLLLVKDANPFAQEFIKIATVPTDQAQPFSLLQGLQFAHASGTDLYLLVAGPNVLNTVTDERGEFVVYLNQVKVSLFMASVNVSHAQSTPVVKEVAVVEGESSSLGLIQLTV
jgi:hypothetical protein